MENKLNKSRAFYREKDEEGDICFYYIDLDQAANSNTDIIKLNEVTVEDSKR
ncbi:hypothetical protein SAMN05661096_00060 [Marivirga sericea]|uniref:Uncharacterized protein n=1 Tax=Marivirga sericea TaxID=1028 RepID=A0A1X7I1Y8_9BACT|nr:hypothetical protein [Marivirga sericea]SMG07656.1 hypothetical protein SAMN05661096_00060 [Marivirga sericea]